MSVPAYVLDAVARARFARGGEPAPAPPPAVELPAPRRRRARARSSPSTAAGRPRRTIYDARGQNEVEPDLIVRNEGDPITGDRDADLAYDGMRAFYDFFWEVFRRDSMDGAGGPLMATVHYSTDFDNAFWNGSRLVFGDGDGKLFTRFTASLDVIGHELAIGVINAETGLVFTHEPGALIQSSADVFGLLVKQYHLHQRANEADWLLGSEVVGPTFPGVAIRSIAAPGTAYEGDQQPRHMRDFVHTEEDQGGVHINAGIPSHAFYLLALELGGFAWSRAGRIWYESLRGGQQGPDSGFTEFAARTLAAAARLFDPNGAESAATRHAWEAVGIEL